MWDPHGPPWIAFGIPFGSLLGFCRNRLTPLTRFGLPGAALGTLHSIISAPPLGLEGGMARPFLEGCPGGMGLLMAGRPVTGGDGQIQIRRGVSRSPAEGGMARLLLEGCRGGMGFLMAGRGVLGGMARGFPHAKRPGGAYYGMQSTQL